MRTRLLSVPINGARPQPRRSSLCHPRLPTRFGLRAKLLSGAAVLLAFTAVIGLLGIRANAQSNAQLETDVRGLGRSRWPSSGSRARSSTRTARSRTTTSSRRPPRRRRSWSTRSRPTALIVGQEPGRGQGLARDRAGQAAVRRADGGDRRVPRRPRARSSRSRTPGKAQEAYALNKEKLLPRVREAADGLQRALRLQGRARGDRAARERSDGRVRPHAGDRAAARRARGRLRDGVLVLRAASSARSGEILDRIEHAPRRTARPICARRSRRVAEGDLTVDVIPVTPPLARTSNDEIGDVAEAVGLIRDNTVASVEAYNAMRAQLAATIGRARRRRRHGRRRLGADGGDVGRDRPRRVARSPPRSPRSPTAPSARSAASRRPARPSRPRPAPRRRAPQIATATVEAAEPGAAPSRSRASTPRTPRARRCARSRRRRPPSARRSSELTERSERIGGIVDHDHRPRRADEPAGAQRRDRGRPRRRAGPRVRGRRRGGPQAGRGLPERGRRRSPR